MTKKKTGSRDFRRFLAIAAAAVCVSAGGVQAQEWTILGAKAMGMGGAGVASVRGAHALYWNPAMLARGPSGGKKSGDPAKQQVEAIADVATGPGFNIGGGLSVVMAATSDTVEAFDTLADDLGNLDLSSIRSQLDAGTPLSQSDLQLALRIVAEDIPAVSDDGNGIILEAIGGPSAQVGRFGFGYFLSAHGGLQTVIDLTGLAFGDEGIAGFLGAGQDRSGLLSGSGQSLADQLTAGGNVTQNQAEELVFQAEQGGVNSSNPSSQNLLQSIVDQTAANQGGDIANSFTDNDSGVVFRGIFVQEVSAGYGHPFGDWLAVGVAAKIMYASTYSDAFLLNDLPEGEDLLEVFKERENEEGSLNLGFDAGVLFTPFHWLAAGVTGHNLNAPSFERESGGSFTLSPQARAGVEVRPLPFLSFAADIDLYKYENEFLPGYKSQILGGGAQVELGPVALRVGASKNLADEEESVVIHAGVGIRMGYFSLDAAALVTPNLEGISTETGAEAPQRAGASLTLGFNIPF